VGYRFHVVEASWPAAVQAGETVRVAIQWRNAGVAPCYKGGNPAVWLIDPNGKIISSKVDDAFDVKSLEVGPSVEQAAITPRDVELRVPGSLAAGEYSVCVSVGDRDGKPVYALPISEYNSGLRYRLGKMKAK
jgi:hypothetical protein